MNNTTLAAQLNQEGIRYFKQNNLSEALTSFKKALHIDASFSEALYNMGLCFKKKNEPELALDNFNRALKLNSKNHAARFHAACLLMQLEKYDDAIHNFKKILIDWPQHFETLTNLATCYLNKKEYEIAESLYQKANQLMPSDTQILFNLAIISAKLGKTSASIQFYQRVLNIDYNFYDAHFNLALLFIAIQSMAYAKQHLKEAHRIKPENATVSHLLNAWENTSLDKAPIEYIKELFDHYADHYEMHLKIALDYHLPEHFLQVFSKLNPPHNNFEILDLGCGTGLCGSTFKSYAKKLTGVDISKNMLQKALEKNCYDELLEDDLVTYLINTRDLFDIVIAGDVLVYFGNLNIFFENLHKVLKPNGIFIFNTEISKNGDFYIKPSGRFGHAHLYIEKLSLRYGFKILHYAEEISRSQNNEPVFSNIYLLTKNI